MFANFDPFVGPLGSVNELFHRLGAASTTSRGTVLSAPRATVTQTEDGYVALFALPGVRAEDVSVDLEGRKLTVRATSSTAPPESSRVLRKEREARSFSAAFTLPTEVDPESVDATLDSGLLTVTLSRADSAQKRRIAVRSTTPAIEADVEGSVGALAEESAGARSDDGVETTDDAGVPTES